MGQNEALSRWDRTQTHSGELDLESAQSQPSSILALFRHHSHLLFVFVALSCEVLNALRVELS